MGWCCMKKYDNFKKALKNLIEAAETQPPYRPIEQAGIAGLFEICYELTWKSVKEILELHGRIPNKLASPRTILKLAYQHGMIADEKGWLDMLETRNVLAHTYSEQDSLAAIAKIKEAYIPLFAMLEEEIERNWLIEDAHGL